MTVAIQKLLISITVTVAIQIKPSFAGLALGCWAPLSLSGVAVKPKNGCGESRKGGEKDRAWHVR